MSDNCSGHKKEVAGISDMKVLAEMIGDLHYDSLFGLLEALYMKLDSDAKKDKEAKRPILASYLINASSWICMASENIKEAYEISKPYMGINK